MGGEFTYQNGIPLLWTGQIEAKPLSPSHRLSAHAACLAPMPQAKREELLKLKSRCRLAGYGFFAWRQPHACRLASTSRTARAFFLVGFQFEAEKRRFRLRNVPLPLPIRESLDTPRFMSKGGRSQDSDLGAPNLPGTWHWRVLSNSILSRDPDLSRKPPASRGKRPVFGKNDGRTEWGINP